MQEVKKKMLINRLKNHASDTSLASSGGISESFLRENETIVQENVPARLDVSKIKLFAEPTRYPELMDLNPKYAVLFPNLIDYKGKKIDKSDLVKRRAKDSIQPPKWDKIDEIQQLKKKKSITKFVPMKTGNILGPEFEVSSDPSLTTRCKRLIGRSKYEKNTSEIYGWWQNLFKTLEHDAEIPPEEQFDVLQKIFGLTLLPKILAVCGTRSRKFKDELSRLSDEDIMQIRKDIQDQMKKESDVATNKRNVSADETLRTVAIQDGQKPSPEAQEVEEVPKCTMYMNFFKRKPNRAAVWRTLPPLSMSEMNLNQKAEAVTERIATDFINWLRDLGGDEELSLSVRAIIEMFEIGFHANSARSLKVGIKELASVPRRVAISKKCPEKAKRAVLRQEIMKDIRASKKKTTYTAFGRQLPVEMQVRPPAENYFKKWMSCDRVPERLASMAAVWQGITHLKSTRAYCEFLLQRPEITPPKYLLECGMMDLRKLQDEDKKSEVSLDVF